ncbi:MULTISPECIES: cytochrome c oxidase assembly factor CtaG [unclassified Oceanobacillus]|uniref:cytochrome c oxidase assembly factor CtaG n=1 Tax=unclassified Oceanobacillus TaxID=2630292 RepID=UPI0012EC995B|nr:cytochrome c oxidase assembly factor CtaG [Oceanobacillus sp. AG]
MWLELQIFGFRALWSPYFFTFCVLLGVIYYLATGPYRHKFGGTEKPTVKQHVLMYTALFLLYVAKGSPIDLLSHIMFSAHMIQMVVFLLIFPILVIKGLPLWVWERVLRNNILGPIIRLLTKPIISLLLFNGLFSIYHIPVVFDFSKSAPVWHFVIHSILLIAAFIVFIPLLLPFKEINTMTPLLKVGYIFANGVLITPACVLIIFTKTPAYEAYLAGGAWLQSLAICVPGDVLDGIELALSGPEMFSPLSTINDQQFGGVIMKTLQEVVYLSLMIRVFFGWFREKSRDVDPVSVEVN